MKDSWAEYEDGGIALRNYFLERVSDLAPVVLERLRAGLDCEGYHKQWVFLGEWSRRCRVDTDWFRQSGEFTLREWASGTEITELVQLGGGLVPITITVYPQAQSTKWIVHEVERASAEAGLTKTTATHQIPATRNSIDWLIRHDVLEEPPKNIIKDAGVYETKFYEALRKLRKRLGIPPTS